ncbi:GRP family sugar transporter [Staphylococcus aureus]
MGILIVSTVGYVGFVVLGDIFGVGGTDALFFQSVGMAIGGFILSINHKTSLKSTALNLLPGVIWGIGNLFMFYYKPKVGVAKVTHITTVTCYRFNLRRYFHFQRRKDRRRMTGIWAGIIIIVIAAIILGNLK